MQVIKRDGRKVEFDKDKIIPYMGNIRKDNVIVILIKGSIVMMKKKEWYNQIKCENMLIYDRHRGFGRLANDRNVNRR